MGVTGRIFGAVIGLAFGIGSMLALVPAIAAFNQENNTMAGWAWVIALVGLILGIWAPTIRRAFGRGFLMLGASVFALPLSMMLLAGRVSGDMVSNADQTNKAAAAIGSGIAGVMMTGVASFIGFFFGPILLIIGLVLALGGRREVVVVQQPATGRTEPRS